MKKSLFITTLLIWAATAIAQKSTNVFMGYLYNDEYQVFLKINFYDNNVTSSTQPLFGEMPGYFGAMKDTREWFITNAKLMGSKTAKLNITNDYGSEDLTATLTCSNDTTFTLTQTGGSRLRIAVNRKWVKMPTKLVFVKKRQPLQK